MGSIDKNFYKPIADKIKQAREAANLTQKTLASMLGLTRAAVANIESGRQQILLHTLYNIAGACDIDPTELLPVFEPSHKTNNHNESLKQELNKKLPVRSVSKILNRLKRT